MSKTVALSQFVYGMRDHFIEFDKWYIKHHLDDTKNYPVDLPENRWPEIFETWLKDHPLDIKD